MNPMPRLGAWSCALVVLLALNACGGGEDSTDAASADRPLLAATPADAVQRLSVAGSVPAGTLRTVTPLSVVSAATIAQSINASRVPNVAPRYAVQTYRLTYTTLDGAGQPIVASGLAAVPVKAPGTSSPMISYQHATIFHDAEAPSNNPTASEPSVVMASLGYVVVAADYVGYGVSKGQPHPYLLSAPMASAVADLLNAALQAAAASGLALNGQLFLFGYSEGGYATVAAHREIQSRGGPMAARLVGSASGGGPLDVGATLDALLARVRAENRTLAALVDPDLLQFLGGALRKQLREEMLRLLQPDDSDVVFQPTFLDNFLANNRSAINRESDVHDWRPLRAVRIFHGRQDQTVPFVASENAVRAMLARAAPDLAWQECSAVPSGHLDCAPPFFQYVVELLGPAARDL